MQTCFEAGQDCHEGFSSPRHITIAAEQGAKQAVAQTFEADAQR